MLAMLLAASIIGSIVLPDPNQQDLQSTLQAPSTEHPMGTDGLGRDVLAWVCGGMRISLAVALSVVVMAATLGVAVGLAAGYLGGLLDAVLMRLVDVQLAVPPVVLFLAVSARAQPPVWAIAVLLALFSWVPYARLVRTLVLVERERGYVAASRLTGASRRRVMLVHLLPATTTPIIVFASLQVGYVLLAEAGLSFLGLGVRPPSTSLGFMISQGLGLLIDAWWIVVFPGVAIVLLILATNLIADGLRDVFRFDVASQATGDGVR
jgi:peptide/nickel transport system permease protein